MRWRTAASRARRVVRLLWVRKTGVSARTIINCEDGFTPSRSAECATPTLSGPGGPRPIVGRGRFGDLYLRARSDHFFSFSREIAEVVTHGPTQGEMLWLHRKNKVFSQASRWRVGVD